MLIYIFFIIIIVAVIFWLTAAFVYWKKWINNEKKYYYRKKLEEIRKYNIEKQIIQYDSILHKILTDYWYKWSLWEQLKKNPHILKWKIQEVWRLHKLRNHIAHEVEIKQNISIENWKKYFEIINNLLK